MAGIDLNLYGDPADPTTFTSANQPDKVGGLDNMAEMSDLTPAAILAELQNRYQKDAIQTYVGDILIVLNPYIRFKIYLPEVQKFYMGNKHAKEDLAPHVFRMADVAYSRITTTGRNQTFVISGESGAGKTVTTKYVIAQVMELCKAYKTDLESKIAKLNPFLEAFGNAKTVMNNNSSRFGKYTELKFDKLGNICGAAMKHYLLEKSRINFRNVGEGTFHVFYQMYAGMAKENALANFGLSVPSSHAFLNTPTCPASDESILNGTWMTCGENDEGVAIEWEQTLEGMKSVGCSEAELSSVTKLLAAALLLGDVKLKDDGNDDCSIDESTEGVVTKIGELLGLDTDAFKQSLTKLSVKMGREMALKNLTVAAASSNRDAMAKSLFDQTFNWIFLTCNGSLMDPTAPPVSEQVTIGVLDIFGFEVFSVNSIEQLCIDLTNEQLQNYFNAHVFKQEQEEYAAESIDVSNIEFKENQPTLDLFLKKGGIFAILDEQCRFPKATDQSFADKCNNDLKSHPSGSYIAPKMGGDPTFTVKHYAGDVTYTTTDFLEKNKDTLSPNIKEMLQAATDDYIKMLYDPGHVKLNPPVTTKKAPTLCSNFKISLLSLMDTMSVCEPQFIRCLKTTSKKIPHDWEDDLVKRQLEYAGVLETIKIRQMGYSFRMVFKDFVAKYKNMYFHYHMPVEETQEVCGQILTGIGIKDFAVGKSKVFMKYYHSDVIAAEAKKHTTALGFLQNIVRGHVTREQYQSLLVPARKTRRDVTEMCRIAELGGIKCFVKNNEHIIQDVKDTEAGSRGKKFEQIKEQAANAQADEAEKKQAMEVELQERIASTGGEITEERTTEVGGYMTFQQNDNSDLIVGALQAPWKEKLDEETNRKYYKNTEEKFTTWVDPRSHQVRPHDPAECKDKQLPFGWDKAETSAGVIFYIDHLSNTHHKEHPKEILEQKQQAYNSKLGQQAEFEAPLVAQHNELRAKLARVTVELGEATEEQGRQQQQARADELTGVISKVESKLEKFRNDLKLMADRIATMKGRKSLSKLNPN